MARALVGPVSERLRATVHGDAGDWLILSHGFGTVQSVWQPLIAKYGAGRRIITYDLAYIGQSEADGRLYRRIATYADDLLAMMDEQRVRRATVLGHSASGMIGLLAGVAAPEHVDRLILLNASPRYLDDADYRGGLTEEALQETFAAIRENYLRWVLAFAPAVTAASGGVGLSEFSRGLLDLRPDVTLAVLRCIYEADLRTLLPHVSCPVEVLQSRRDIAVPLEVGAWMADQLPAGRLHVLDAEGHLPHLTTPARLWPALDRILGGG